MGVQINGFVDAVTLNGNMSTAAGSKWTIATMDTTAAELTLFTTCVADEAPIGVFVDDYAVGSVAAVATSGIGKVICSGNTNNIAVGDWIKATTAGVGILAGHGEMAVGQALDPCTAATTAIRVRIAPGLAAYTNPAAVSSSSATPTALTVANLKVPHYNLTLSSTATIALTIPSAGDVQDGALLSIYKSGTGTNALTITVAGGTINSHTATTDATMDAQYDFTTLRANKINARWSNINAVRN